MGSGDAVLAVAVAVLGLTMMSHQAVAPSTSTVMPLQAIAPLT